MKFINIIICYKKTVVVSGAKNMSKEDEDTGFVGRFEQTNLLLACMRMPQF